MNESLKEYSFRAAGEPNFDSDLWIWRNFGFCGAIDGIIGTATGN